MDTATMCRLALLFVSLLVAANAYEPKVPKSKKSDTKSSVTINTVAGIPSIIKATIDKKTKERVKRRSQRCIPACLSDMHRMNAEFDEKVPDNGIIDAQIWNKEYLNRYCSTFKATVGCVEKCGGNPNKMETEMLEQDWIETATFVCIDRYKDFESNAHCFSRVSDRLNTECAPKCGHPYFMREQITVMETTGEFEAPLSNICGFIKCVHECAPPIFEDECDSKTAQTVAEKFTEIQAKTGEKEFEKYSMDYPDRCSQLANPNTSFPDLKPWDPNNPEPVPVIDEPDFDHHNSIEGMMQMQTQVLRQQLQVLEKEKVKLELEIEVLKMRKN